MNNWDKFFNLIAGSIPNSRSRGWGVVLVAILAYIFFLLKDRVWIWLAKRQIKKSKWLK